MTPPFFANQVISLFWLVSYFVVVVVYNFILCFLFCLFLFLFDIQMLQLFIRASKVYDHTIASRLLPTIHQQDYYHCGQVPAVLYKRISII
jgi:hypothetical protein